MKISYKVSGRFGNNLFQYIATKVIQNELSKKNNPVDYVYNTPLENSFVITDNNYFDILKDPSIVLNKNIYLDGYFQFDKHIIENKDYINSILSINNNENINDNIEVSFLANCLKENKYVYDENDFIVHLRLDDFIGDRILMKPNMYIDVISSLDNVKNLIIVVDKIKYHWESEYLRMIFEYASNVKKINVSISRDDMFKDFCKLYYASNFISSNSTFSYLAGLLGNHKYTWCPVNTIYPHQNITKFDEHTISKKVDYI